MGPQKIDSSLHRGSGALPDSYDGDYVVYLASFLKKTLRAHARARTRSF